MKFEKIHSIIISFLIVGLPFLGAELGFSLSGFRLIYSILLWFGCLMVIVKIKNPMFITIMYFLLLCITLFNIFWHHLVLNEDSVNLTLLLLNGFLLHLLIYQFVRSNPKNIPYLLNLVFLIFVFQGALSILQFLTPGLIAHPVKTYLAKKLVIRAQGVTGHPGPFGVFMGMIWPVALCSVLFANTKNKFFTNIFVFLFGSCGVIFSLTRSAWIGDFVALIVVALTIVILKIEVNKKTIFFTALMLLVLVLVSFRLVWVRFFASDIIWQLNLRLSLNKLAWQLFTRHPFLGVGVGNSLSTLRCISPGIRYQIHNQYFFWLAEYGIVGSLVWLIFLISCLGLTMKTAKRASKKGQFLETAFGINAMFFGLLVTNNSGLPMTHISIFMLFSLFIGLTAGIRYYLNHELY